MCWSRLVFLILYFRSVYCINYNFYNQIVLDENIDDVVTVCESKLCIRKCCGMNEYVYMENSSVICESLNSSEYTNGINIDKLFFNLLNVPLYDNYYHDLKVNKNLSEVFLLAPGKFGETSEAIENITFEMEAFVGTDYGFSAYLTEGGIFYLEYPNAYERWTPVNSSNFCIDVNHEMNPKFWTVLTLSSKKLFGILLVDDNELYSFGLIASSFFLIIVLLVYMVLPELRNLAGLVLMAYVFSLASAFLLLASLQLGDIKPENCIVLSGVTYFFFLSSFCWMSIMSYDIWSTFRYYAKARAISHRKEYFKFGMYCIYACGIPMVMTIVIIIFNQMDLSYYPWFVKPQIPTFGCFLQGGQAFVYLYIPMVILIVLNWIFYLMTSFNIWRMARGTAILNSTHRLQKNRFVVYLKLLVIMGINWILEVGSYLAPELEIWAYTDAYNLLIGFSIFLIFIWKQRIYRKLKAWFINVVYKCQHRITSPLQNYESQISLN